MKSIRTYLLLALLAIITLVTFVSLLQGYNSSIDKAHQLFDNRLQTMAEVIASVNQDTDVQTTLKYQYSPAVFFQIWNEDFTLLARSKNAPSEMLMMAKSHDQFEDVNFNRYRWRMFILHDELLHRWIITAERADIRYSLAEGVVLSSIIPIVLAIPFAAFIIWIAIGLGLKPLKELSTQLSFKKAEDLSPVVLQNEPEELSQLLLTTNALLHRLETAFRREQQFSADAAHELRTPISLLKVQLHNLQADVPNKSVLEPLAQGIERMGHVIEQILSLYRNSPDQALHNIREQVDLFLVTQTFIANHYQQFVDKKQKISLIGEAGTIIEGNQFALETLVQNLVTNASKYTPEQGEIVVTIKQAPQLQLIVEDSGPGIPQNLRERVLERFYRVDGDQHDSGTIGCGLGLAIVKHICDLHQAEISLSDSSKLGGLKIMTTFSTSNRD